MSNESVTSEPRACVHVVTFTDGDNYRLPMAVFSTWQQAEKYVADFKELHKDDSFWQLDSDSIDPFILDKSI